MIFKPKSSFLGNMHFPFKELNSFFSLNKHNKMCKLSVGEGKGMEWWECAKKVHVLGDAFVVHWKENIFWN